MIFYKFFDRQKDFHIFVVLSFKHIKILIFGICLKLCSDVLRGLLYLGENEKDVVEGKIS